MKLVDQHGRRIRKLRLSLTDRCNLRCHYCMPVDQTFMEEHRYLTPFEQHEIVSQLVDFGLEEVRLTGGEPLLRKTFNETVSLLSSIPLKKIGLTTNGIFLDRHFESLIKNKVFHINVSLDSLDPENYRRITHGAFLEKVVSNIRRTRDLGLVVKVNAVAMKGINDHEVLDFVSFAEREQVEVRFLELMRIGHALEEQARQFISADELISRIKRQRELKHVTVAADSTSFNFVTEGKGHIGFIASESRPFCGQCSRWRLSADGTLRACLLKDDGRSLRNKSPEQRLQTFGELLGLKPYLRPLEVNHPMNAIGG